MKDTIKAVAFDIDGTMYANWRLYIQLGCYVARNLPFFIKYAKVRSILHRTAPLGDFYEYQARLLGIEMKIEPQKAKELIENNVYKGLTPYLKKVKPFPHLKECLEALKKAGLKIAILSDFPPEQKGDIWGMEQMFDVVCGSEALGALKPSKYTFGLLAAKLDVAPEEVLYVGNSISADIEGASAIGMKTAYLMPLWRKIFNKPLPIADISFKNYRQLQDFVLH
ncbi:MAG: HAD family hydrolase [Spirochaetaceae bacterium]|nr:HAD family hydrolase [Spirochaetaceae bacterium]